MIYEDLRSTMMKRHQYVLTLLEEIKNLKEEVEGLKDEIESLNTIITKKDDEIRISKQ